LFTRQDGYLGHKEITIDYLSISGAFQHNASIPKIALKNSIPKESACFAIV